MDELEILDRKLLEFDSCGDWEDLRPLLANRTCLIDHLRMKAQESPDAEKRAKMAAAIERGHELSRRLGELRSQVSRDLRRATPVGSFHG